MCSNHSARQIVSFELNIDFIHLGAFLLQELSMSSLVYFSICLGKKLASNNVFQECLLDNKNYWFDNWWFVFASLDSSPKVAVGKTLEERDPKFDAMLGQMVGRIRAKPGGKLEMGEVSFNC